MQQKHRACLTRILCSCQVSQLDCEPYNEPYISSCVFPLFSFSLGRLRTGKAMQLILQEHLKSTITSPSPPLKAFDINASSSEQDPTIAAPFGGLSFSAQTPSNGPYGSYTTITLPKTIQKPFPLRISPALIQRVVRTRIASKRLLTNKISDCAKSTSDDQGECGAEHIKAMLSCKSSELEEVLATASLVVGMHSDQPTEAIIDFGLATGTPVAVVPCCVFPNLFPERKLAQNGEIESGQSKKDTRDHRNNRTTLTGVTPNLKRIRRTKRHQGRVRTYEEFCEYLLAKSPALQAERLDFEGRNLVIHLPPKAAAAIKEENKKRDIALCSTIVQTCSPCT